MAVVRQMRDSKRTRTGCNSWEKNKMKNKMRDQLLFQWRVARVAKGATPDQSEPLPKIIPSSAGQLWIRYPPDRLRDPCSAPRL
jgi:hypothetical protein